MINRIPVVDLNDLPPRQQLEAAATENTYRIFSEAPWIADLSNLAAELNEKPGSVKAKYIRLRKLADRAAAVVAKNSACSKGCSQCCHISVAINEVEAGIISQVTGLKFRRQSPLVANSDLTNKYFGQPCPFLKGQSCSIYAERPMACRLHFAISNTAVMCDTQVPPELSAVVNMDFRKFWFEYMSVLHVSNMADIRDYFGTGK
ncbi:YkgJ family cysteine cluster protein [Stutzerimonas stutzeri]|uniref:YkgJ family cysteine cluster protein n=1 Tax=Stutzerimonas stutzeri TaxID=316 RepID=UPI001BCB2B9E|nr:YkgJ family cysteine cluster protein [Stutzerimonas stutzeri]